MKSNKNKSNNKNDNNNNNNTINNSYDEILLKLPTYSLEVYEDDYLKELILEPLSLLVSGDVIVVSSTKSPIKKSKKDNSSISFSSNNNNNENSDNSDSNDEDDNSSDENDYNDSGNNNNSSNNNYYCPFCKKRFQTEQTWNTHINSSKHLKSIKDQKKKTTSSNLTPTKSSPSPVKNNSSNNNNSNNNNNNNTKDNDFILEQLNLIQQTIKIKNSKPNLACKNLFNIAKSYSSRQYIRDSAKSLFMILDILKSQQTSTTTISSSSSTTSESITLNNIFQNVSLSCKTNLYIARLVRLFQSPLSEHHFIQSFIQLELISNEDLIKYENLLSLSSNPSNLYKLFLNKINLLLKEIKKNQKQQQQQEENQSKKDNTDNSSSGSNSSDNSGSINSNNNNIENKDDKVLTILNYLNEISGGLCYCKVNFKSIVIYLLATCIGYKFKFYKESLISNQRALKLLVSLKHYHWSIDLHLNNILIIIKLKKQFQQNQQNQQQKDSTISTASTNSTNSIILEYNNLIKDNLIKIFKYCIITQDKVRLKEILENESIKKLLSLKQFLQDEQLLCLIELSNHYLIDNFKDIEILKDQYEHIIFTNKEFIYIFNQLIIINNNKLIIN